MKADAEHWHRLGPVGRFTSGQAEAVKIAGRRLAVGRAEGRFFALDDECPHAGASLAFGKLRKGALVCPLHFWEFDVFTGQCFRFGARVTPHPVRVEDGILWVRLSPSD